MSDKVIENTCWHFGYYEDEIEDQIKCKQVGQITSKGFTEMTGRVYSQDGLTPAVRTFADGNTETKIAEPIAYDEQNQYLRQDGCVGTLTTDGSSPKHNNRIVEPNLKTKMCNELIASGAVKENDVIRHSYTNSRMKGEMKDIQQNNISPTLDTRCDCLGVVTKYELSPQMKKYIVSGDDKYKVGERNLKLNRDIAVAKTTREGNTRADASDYISNNVSENYQLTINENLADYRIRKLTPRECGRLMGVRDDDITIMAKNQSNSSLYHLYGDSIVVDVLMAIIGMMI